MSTSAALDGLEATLNDIIIRDDHLQFKYSLRHLQRNDWLLRDPGVLWISFQDLRGNMVGCTQRFQFEYDDLFLQRIAHGCTISVEARIRSCLTGIARPAAAV